MSNAQPLNDTCYLAKSVVDLDNSCISRDFNGATFDLIAPTCAPDNYPNVWFKFIAEGETAIINVSNDSTAYLAIYAVHGDQCDLTSITQISCGENQLIVPPIMNPDSLYLLGVSFASDSVGNFDICIYNPNTDDAPYNDAPCFALEEETDGSCFYGTTENATNDWLNPNCPSQSVESVWYTFNIAAGHTGARFILDPITMTGNYSFFITTFNNNNCSSYPLLQVPSIFCDNHPAPDTIEVGNLTSTQTYHLQVASSDGTGGIFSLCIEQLPDPSGCALNDICEVATDISTPHVPEDTLCYQGCSLSANPGPTNLTGTCFYFQHPTVWHQFVTDESTSGARIVLSSTDLQNPQIGVYRGDSCDVLIPLVCEVSTGGFLDISVWDLQPLTKYYIAVSDILGGEGEYDICMDMFADESGCKLFSNIIPMETSFGSPLEGPYQSGESVTFCYQITAWQKNLCNWLQGVMPTFGNAWDPSSFRFSGEPAFITQELQPHTAGSWDWYPEGSVDYNVDNPDKGFFQGDPLLGGWYFVNALHGGVPDESRGDSDNCANESNLHWEVCFTLKIKDFDDCMDIPNGPEASIQFFSFSDSEIGGYPAVSCLLDLPDAFGAQVVCCEGPDYPDDLISVCNGEAVDYDLNPGNDPELSFSWRAIAPSGIFGAQDGAGELIEDQLFNFTTSVQTVFYLISVADADSCYGPPATISVDVLPRLFANAGNDIDVCAGADVEMGANPAASGGSGNYNYKWSNGAPPLARPTVQFLEDETVFLTVTDSKGCQAVDSLEVSVIEAPMADMRGEATVCRNEEVTFFIELQGQPPFRFSLYANGNLLENIVTSGSLYEYTHTLQEVTEFTIEDFRDSRCDGFSNGSFKAFLGFEPLNIINQILCFGESTIVNGVELDEEGIYNFTIENGAVNGCDSFIEARIQVLSEMQILSQKVTHDDGSGNGTIKLKVTGGESPYTYAWSNGETGDEIINLEHGFYDVTVTDDNDCTVEYSFEVELNSGIEDMINTYGFSMFPNPVSTNNDLHIKSGQYSGKVSCQLYNLQGKLEQVHLADFVNHDEVKVNLNLNAGTYYLRILDDKGSIIFTRMLVIQ
jgi:hypothetical protein